MKKQYFVILLGLIYSFCLQAQGHSADATVAGSSCDDPISILEDVAVVLEANEEKYFSYTPSISGFATITISNSENLSVRTNKSCDMIQWVPEYELPVEVVAGEPLLLYVKNWGESEKESFGIHTVEANQGDLCGNPLIARIGTNNLKATVGKHWYSYTPSQDCLVEIVANSAVVNNQTVSLEAYESCETSIGMIPVTSEERYASYRMNANQTYLIEWSVLQPLQIQNIEFTIEEIAIQPGDFCDLAIPVTIGTTFVIPKASDKWYSFTATESGWVEIESTWSHLNVPFLKTDCDDYYAYPMVKKDDKYVYMIEGGTSYRLCMSNVDTQDAQILWQMGAKSQGDTCEDPFLLDVDVVKEIEANSVLWHKAVASQDGVYKVVGSFGFGADVNVKRGDCSASFQEASMDYDLIANVLEIELAKGEALFVQTKTGSESGTLVIYQMKQGDWREKPVALTVSGTIHFDATPLAYRWYEFTANADSVFISSSESGQGVAVHFDLYDVGADNSLFTETELIKNEAGEYIGYHVFADRGLIKKGAKYHLKVYGSKNAFDFYLATPQLNGIGQTGIPASVYYDAVAKQLFVSHTYADIRLKIFLYSVRGEKVGEWSISDNSTTPLDLSAYSSGVYVVKVVCGEKGQVIRIVLH